MEQPAPSQIGVVVASPGPVDWPGEAQWVAPPAERPVVLPPADPPVWPRPAQLATAALLSLALGLLAWHAYGLQRWGARPTTLETSAAAPPAVGSLDLNRADRAQLLQLPGVGAALAQRIEDYRSEHD